MSKKKFGFLLAAIAVLGASIASSQIAAPNSDTMKAATASGVTQTPIANLLDGYQLVIHEISDSKPNNTIVYSLGDNKLKTVLPLPFSNANSDFIGQPSLNEFYDVFYSNSNGTLNQNGNCLTIRGQSTIQNFQHTFNIKRVDIIDNNLEVIRSFDNLSAFTPGSIGYVSGSEAKIIDATLNTASDMGGATGNQFVSATLCLSQLPTPKRGITYVGMGPHGTIGTATFMCQLMGPRCNIERGDTLCTSKRPLLCYKDLKAPKPTSVVESSMVATLPAQPNSQMTQTFLWSGGLVGTTAPISPPATLTAANQLCVAEFGEGWRVAKTNERGGANERAWQAYGGVGSLASTQRVWVDYIENANANCWNRN